jgi:hypothetical protein
MGGCSFQSEHAQYRSKELVRHSLVPDLLSPGLSHQGLEPGLVASLRGGLLDCILRVGIDPVSDHTRAGIGYLKGLTLVLTWTTMGLTLGSVGKPATRDPPGTLSNSPPLPPRLLLSWVSLSLSGPVDIVIWINSKIVICKKLHGKSIDLFHCGSLLSLFSKKLCPILQKRAL